MVLIPEIRSIDFSIPISSVSSILFLVEPKRTGYWTCLYKTFKTHFYLLTLSQTSPGFYVSAVQSLLKTLWEKEKLLLTSNFSFFHSVFYPFGELSASFIEFEIAVCNLCQFGRVQNLLFGKGSSRTTVPNHFEIHT